MTETLYQFNSFRRDAIPSPVRTSGVYFYETLLLKAQEIGIDGNKLPCRTQHDKQHGDLMVTKERFHVTPTCLSTTK